MHLDATCFSIVAQEGAPENTLIKASRALTSISREEVDGCDKYTDVSASKRDQALFLHPQPPKLS